MAPELMDHPEKKCDLAACDIDLAACDIYSLGRVILFMFSTTCFKTDRDERTRIDEYFKEEKFPEFAKPIQEIVHRCCELDPKKRCSLKEVAVCLKELLSGAGVTSLLNKSSRSRAGVTSLLNKGSRSRAGVTSLLNKLGRLESKAIAVKADAVKEVAVKVTNLQDDRRHAISLKTFAMHVQELLSRYSKYAA
jgi:serine/threonine protein kinase